MVNLIFNRAMYRKSICVHHTLCIYIILSYRFHVHIWNKNRKLITIYLRLSTYIIPPPVSPRSLNFCTLTLFPSPFWIFQSLPYYCISLPSPSVFPLPPFLYSTSSPSISPLHHLLYLPYLTFCMSPTSPSISLLPNLLYLPLPHLPYLPYLTFCISLLPQLLYLAPPPFSIFHSIPNPSRSSFSSSTSPYSGFLCIYSVCNTGRKRMVVQRRFK